MFKFNRVNILFNINFNPPIIIMLATSEFRIICITIKSRITINTITIQIQEMDDESHQRNSWTDDQILTNDDNSTIAKITVIIIKNTTQIRHSNLRVKVK